MQAKEIERLNDVYKKLLRRNGVDMYGESLTAYLHGSPVSTQSGLPV